MGIVVMKTAEDGFGVNGRVFPGTARIKVKSNWSVQIFGHVNRDEGIRDNETEVI